ncbi:MAG: hypothetical protein AAFN08_14070 [Cyanobacteria bacterium J06559_3]
MHLEGHFLGLTLEQQAVYRRHVEMFKAGGWTACGWYAVITQALKEAGCNERVALVLGRVIDDIELERSLRRGFSFRLSWLELFRAGFDCCQVRRSAR